MLLPQFTIRTLFGITAIAAMVAWILSQAAYGALWAQCAGWMFVFVGFLFGLYAIVFLFTWVVGQMLGMISPSYQPVATPFAVTPPEPVLPLGENPFAASESLPPEATPQ